jgi:hypothetical protein
MRDEDVISRHRSEEEFMQDIKKLTDEGDDALFNNEGMNPQEQLEVLAQVLQDISNMVSLRASGRPYAPIHEAFGDDPDPYGGYRSTRKATMALHDAMDEGMLEPRVVADAALRYMSEADVADMAESEGLLYDEWEGDYE